MARNNSGSPSASNRRRGSRTFKARRALIACQRCRRLKKSCQPTEQERCLRCCLSEQEKCIYMDVANDPSAPRASSAVLVPDSPTISPESPLTPSQSYPSDHATTGTRIPRPPFHYTHPMHNPNSQSAGLSIPFMPIFAQPPPIYPPDVFPSPQFDTNFPSIFPDDLYDDESQALCVQTPLPFTTNHQHSDEDMVDPPYPHRYLRSTPDPSLLIHNHFTVADSVPSSLNLYGTTSFLQDISPVVSTSNHNMSMSSQSPMLYSPSSKMPCCFCSPGTEDCTLHAPEYSYHWDPSTEDDMQD